MGNQGETTSRPPNKGSSVHLNVDANPPLKLTGESPETFQVPHPTPPHPRQPCPATPQTYLTSPTTTVMISYLADFHFNALQNPPS